MDTEDIKEYASKVLGFFREDEETECSEIGDGNINYVSVVRSLEDGRSVVIKQADRLLRSSGRPLDIHRSMIEAEVLKAEGMLAPGFVPEVYNYDKAMAAIAMEDVSDYRNLRNELADGRVHAHFAGNISAFMVDTLHPTTDLVMDAEEKKRKAGFFVNPELCRITEDLVLTEPYFDYKGRNIITVGNEEFVAEHLYGNSELHAEIAGLRLNFMNNAQALIHGDLHSGSIFINENGIKVIDPEFAFYGPMGYDIGNVVGSLFFAAAAKRFASAGSSADKGVLESILKCIDDVYDLTLKRLRIRYDELVELPLYRVWSFRDSWIHSVMSDASGYAGTEIIRRTVGDSKVPELSSITDPAQKILMERSLIELDIRLIKERGSIIQGSDITGMFPAS